MLGFDLSERTISRWMKRAPSGPEPGKRWLAFLRSHREAIAAMDFFAAPTITFGVLDGFLVVGHDRPRIPHFNATMHPTSSWIVQQVREASPFEPAPRFPSFDRDAKHGRKVPRTAGPRPSPVEGARMVGVDRRDRVRLYFRLHPQADVSSDPVGALLRYLHQEFRQPCLLVWDHLNAHRAKRTTQFVARLSERHRLLGLLLQGPWHTVTGRSSAPRPHCRGHLA